MSRSAAHVMSLGAVVFGLWSATIAKAEQELAKYIGAVARVVVKRAAAKAKDEEPAEA